MEEALLVHKTPQQLIWYNNLYSELESFDWAIKSFINSVSTWVILNIPLFLQLCSESNMTSLTIICLSCDYSWHARVVQGVKMAQ